MRIYLILCYVFLSFCIFSDGTIFVLHRFDDERYPSTSIDTEWLKKYFDYLNENDYEVVSLSSIVEKIEKNEEIPENWVSFTIDDAYKSFYEKGLPIFREYQFPFALFVLTEATERNFPDYMNWEEIREASNYGEVGSHSYKHPHLTRISDEEIKKDTEESLKLLIENVEGVKNYYAYPYGEYDDRVKKILVDLGIKVILNQSTSGVSENTDIHDINRIALGNNENIGLKLKIGNLPVKWDEVRVEEGYVKNIKVYMPKEINKVEVFLSGYGWEYAYVSDGVLEHQLDKELKLSRNRIFIRDFNDRWSSYILIK
jgi:peptidoglycan/xylan/chitin deacetylase (PgdA/CDA1 family)